MRRAQREPNGRIAPRRGEDARPRGSILLLIAAVAAALALLAPWRPSTGPEAAAYDFRLRLRHTLAPRALSPQIVVIGVGQRDSEVFGPDLASRQAFQDLLINAREWGVASVTFDYFFEEKKSFDDFLALAVDGVPTILGYKFQSVAGFLRPAGDPPTDFVEVLSGIENTTDSASLLATVRDVLEPYSDSLKNLRESGRSADGRALSSEERRETVWRTLWSDTAARLALTRWFSLTQGRAEEVPPEAYAAKSVAILSPSPARAARALGFANIEKGEERIVRRAPLVYSFEGRLFPSISLATVLHHHGVSFTHVTIDWGRAISYEPVRNGSGAVSIPIDERGNYLVNFRAGEEYLSAQPTLELAAHRLLDGERAAQRLPERLRGAVVLVGEVITGGTATDTQPIPLQAKFPMVGLHANVIDNVLNGDFLRESPPRTAGVVTLLLLGVAAWVVARFPLRTALVVAAGTQLTYLLASIILFFEGGIVLPLVVPGILSLGGLAVMAVYAFGVTERDRRLVREVFGKTVSPRIGEEILRNYDDESLWGAEREVTVLFVDIRGYTTLSETQPPATMLELLDRFYDAVSEAVFEHDGQVNKFLGDAALALFGALPDEAPDHAVRAVRCAAAVQRRMKRLAESEEWTRLGLRFQTGAGIQTGRVTVGIVGGRDTRIEYTAIGDTVNVAARLQGLAAENQIAVGGETVEAIGGPGAALFTEIGARLIPAETLQVKGRRQPVNVHRIELDHED